jgi:DNA invertase Pin-like site-specific DNA recombinase
MPPRKNRAPKQLKPRRKTNRGLTPRDVLERARNMIKDGTSIRKVAKDFGIDRMTLKRYCDKREKAAEPPI